MTINTKYNLGEKVKIKDYYSAKSEGYLAVNGEIKRIIVSNTKDGGIAIKYDVEYLSGNSWRIRGLWEDDLKEPDEGGR